VLKDFILSHPKFTRETAQDYILLFLGALLQALAMRLFLVPALLASGGVSGLAQIINHYTNWPIGLMILLGNLPIFLVGWRYLGGPRFALRSAFAVVNFALFTDLLKYYLPTNGLTQDLVLNALYGGVVSGAGFGLVYKGRGTSGGSDILARILNHRLGISLARSYMMTDALIMFLAGISFSWENALYALVMLYVSGVVAETVSEGESVIRTALIVTSRPQEMTDQILHDMERGVTLMQAKGGFTGIKHTMLYCVISRAEVHQLKGLVCDVDPQAFMVIGAAYEALGEGFKSLADG
jgi:uncharacterized membrane-anchored protein YitT (DUF2179 family)